MKTICQILIAEEDKIFRRRLENSLFEVENELQGISFKITNTKAIQEMESVFHWAKPAIAFINFKYFKSNATRIASMLDVQDNCCSLVMMIGDATGNEVGSVVNSINPIKSLFLREYILNENYSSGLIKLLIKFLIAEITPFIYEKSSVRN